MATILRCRPVPIRQNQAVFTFDPRSGEFTSSIIEHWSVLFDDINVRPADVTTLASGSTNTLPSPDLKLPVLGQGIIIGETGAVGIVKRVQPERSGEKPTAFDVQLEYSLAQLYTSGQKFNASLTIDGVGSTIPVDVDKDGNAIANTAGDPYDPQQVIDSFEELVTVSYETDTPPESDLSSARGLVNSDSISFSINGVSKSWNARQVKLKNASLSATFNGALSSGYASASQWQVKIELLCKLGTDTFEAKLVDQGFQYWSTSGSTQIKQKFTDDAGQPSNTPQYLDGTGGKLAVTAGSSPTVTNPSFNKFKLEDEYAFNSFLGGI